MDNLDSSQRRPSLYAAAILAKLVYTIRNRLRVRIQSRKSRTIQSSTSEFNHFARYEDKAGAQAAVNENSKAHAQTQMYATHGDNFGKAFNQEQLSRAVSRIENHDSGWNVPLNNAAQDDHKFLTFDAQQYSRFWTQRQARTVLDSTTLLLRYITSLQTDSVARREAALRHNICNLDEFDKYLANLEHIMRSLQQAALNILVQDALVLALNASYWFRWLNCAYNTNDWYSEWSSGRPPLNSTMPWNIKASLVVLWGVCWMFYTPPSSFESSERAWSLQNQSSNWNSQTSVSTDGQAMGTVAAISSPLENIQVQFQHRPSDVMPYPSHSDHQSPFAQSGNSGVDQSDVIGPIRSGYVTHGAMSQNAPGSSHMVDSEYNDARFAQQAASRQNYGPVVPSTGIASVASPGTRSVVPSTGARQGSAVNPSRGSPAFVSPFFAQDPNSWQQLPENISHYGSWSQPDPNAISSASVYPSPGRAKSYALNITDTSSPLSGYSPTWENQHKDHTRNPTSAFVGMHSATAYPPSPISGPSDRESTAPITLPINPAKQSRSAGNSPIEDRRRDSQDPPQYLDGSFYCDDPKCASNPPRFQRKCEWKKHRDTHTRPYICRVPGCEKIQGFTYSGGLLRHEREVHQAHGGPIKRHYCPYADCKRSEGLGFARKENLTEHLRRVHRNQVAVTGTSIKSESPVLSSHVRTFSSDSSRKRKRQHDTFSEESSAQQATLRLATLESENGKLKRELQEKDAEIIQLRQLLGYPPRQ